MSSLSNHPRIGTMRAIAAIFWALALTAPVSAAVGPRTADRAVAGANPEETANGVGWKQFVHTFSPTGSGTRNDTSMTIARAAPELAPWALMVGGIASAGRAMRRRGWFRN